MAPLVRNLAYLDALTPEEVLGLTSPTGMPLRYDLDDLAPVRRGGQHLEPAAAARAAVEVRSSVVDATAEWSVHKTL